MNHVDEKYQLSTPLVFFNHHEYLVSKGTPSLVVNHFPNIYADAPLHTRVIRIPRWYCNEYSDLIPQFSTVYPGDEEGAINGGDAVGNYDLNKFGVTSKVLGLDSVISKDELYKVVLEINNILSEAFTPYSLCTAVENILDILTGGMSTLVWNHIGGTHTNRTLRKLDTLIDEQNKHFKEAGIDLVVVSPQTTGYLSFIAEIQELFTKSGVFASDLKLMREKIEYDLSRDRKWKHRAQQKAKAAKIKIGHGGTLDPMASGVLVVGVGSGTKKLQYYLSECQKTYETKALLGMSTTTGDSEGEILTQNEIQHITPELVKSTVKRFVGEIKQTPPIFSALKVNGKPLYEYAREGLPLPKQIKVRDVKVNSIQVIDDDLLSTNHEFVKLESELDENGVPKEHALKNNPTLNDSPLYFADKDAVVPKPRLLPEGESLPQKLPLLHLIADVSSGTYIRSLISDIGRAMQSSAYMVELIRTKQSEWELDKNVFTIQDFHKEESVWGPVLKKVLDQGGANIDLERELAGRKRTIDKVE
ncbi:PUS4 [Candida oxycetoniae]|uniref:tRNA pseudouridine(55) synthase n=1 Tax=Candida oxycetoniae TaxID=497107 RepID=A0AAI9SXN4_9ASCO|nr:PUS4 [Candida oxycetoniae]KAI3404897.2 PUS4 [Candida oxycetoniae]